MKEQIMLIIYLVITLIPIRPRGMMEHLMVIIFLVIIHIVIVS